MMRPPNHVTEDEIDAAEKLRGRSEYATALSLTQDMLRRVQDDGDMRMRLLFDVLYCSTRLGEDSVTNEAIHELEQMPEPKMSRIFIDFIQAMTYIAHGRYQEGLHLIDANLRTEFMERQGFLVDNISIWLIEETLLPAWPAAMKHLNHSTKRTLCFRTEREKPPS
jgi:hypothetical protein